MQRQCSVLFLILLLLICIWATNSNSLAELNSYAKQLDESIEHTHKDDPSKACMLESIKEAVRGYVDTTDFRRATGIDKDPTINTFIQTVCFSVQSLGNSLSQYFEGRLCSQAAGLHYIGLSTGLQRNDFFRALPMVVEHSNVTQKHYNSKEIDAICPCPSMCHEWHYGLMHARMSLVREMFLTAIGAHWSVAQHNNNGHLQAVKMTMMGQGHALLNSSQQLTLPQIPAVSVHYRCGDNTVQHYGFMPFRVMKRKIPSNASTIYVMAESPSRGGRPHHASRCTAIFDALHKYLMDAFPTAVVVMLRGADVFDDLARLTYSPLVICSVSTYCLWPAISNNNTVYFPSTRLVAKEEIKAGEYGAHLHWLTAADEKAILGTKAVTLTNHDLVELLKAV